MRHVAEPENQRFRMLALSALPQLNRLARALCSNRANADDLVQDTYVRALRYLDSFQGGDIRAWLVAIMRNLHRSSFIGQPEEVEIGALEGLGDPTPGPEQIVQRRHEDRILRNHIAALPEGLREALLLREFAELSYAEIAKIQNVPIGTVMSRLARARASLRESLSP